MIRIELAKNGLRTPLLIQAAFAFIERHGSYSARLHHEGSCWVYFDLPLSRRQAIEDEWKRTVAELELEPVEIVGEGL